MNKETIINRIKELNDKQANVFDEQLNILAVKLKIEKLTELLWLFDEDSDSLTNTKDE